MKIAMVLTSHDQFGNTGLKSGFLFEEFAAPHFVFRDAGVDLTLASQNGGQPPLDPKSDVAADQTPAMERFRQDEVAESAVSQEVKLADLKSEDFDTVFYVGAALARCRIWPRARSRSYCSSLSTTWASPFALVCDSPGHFGMSRARGNRS
ncbi:type 1 glutamine amidotransferase family protein [Bryocella elongata]|uniref:hypothetical protein n=1 Tax=Bryocella elongata TaxID=863522 RepID=UPI00190E8A54|nr:hypothetical protein [Bryocella elongata]